MVGVASEMFGSAVRTGFCYWATDPMDNPHYIATLLQTAKMNNVDPCAWLSLTPQRIANGWPSGEIDALMPWNHAA